MDLALFDFEGTITSEQTDPAFVRFAVSARRKLLGGVLLETSVEHRGSAAHTEGDICSRADAIERRANQQFQVVDDHLAEDYRTTDLPEQILERVVIEQVLRLDDLSLPEAGIRGDAPVVGLCILWALVTRRRSMAPPA